MPIREWRCDACNIVQDRIESSNCTQDGPKCKKCDGVTERVEISLGSFRIYGEGAFRPNQR